MEPSDADAVTQARSLLMEYAKLHVSTGDLKKTGHASMDYSI
jgi:hypothetical protein